MTPEIEGLLQELGNTALDIVDVEPQKLLFYCRVQEGAFLADIFFRTEPEGTLWYLSVINQTRDLVYRFWDTWKATPGNKEWRYMMYVVEDGDFTLDFLYPDQLPKSENPFTLRTEALIKYFGTSKVSKRQTA